ncbi:hypothetical protein J6O86_00820 [bacterium]|nr:hypothetical protein [bacterium]
MKSANRWFDCASAGAKTSISDCSCTCRWFDYASAKNKIADNSYDSYRNSRANRSS